jgi:hypothetical protein
VATESISWLVPNFIPRFISSSGSFLSKCVCFSLNFFKTYCSIACATCNFRQISESLQIVDDIAFFCSNMQNNQVLFCRSHFVDLQKPKKNRLSENYCTDASRFVCQRTEKWRMATESISWLVPNFIARFISSSGSFLFKCACFSLNFLRPTAALLVLPATLALFLIWSHFSVLWQTNLLAWKSLRLYPIICSIRVSKTEIKRQISESLQIVDDIAFFCSNMQNNQVLFCRSHFVHIRTEERYIIDNLKAFTDLSFNFSLWNTNRTNYWI